MIKEINYKEKGKNEMRVESVYKGALLSLLVLCLVLAVGCKSGDADVTSAVNDVEVNGNVEGSLEDGSGESVVVDEGDDSKENGGKSVAEDAYCQWLEDIEITPASVLFDYPIYEIYEDEAVEFLWDEYISALFVSIVNSKTFHGGRELFTRDIVNYCGIQYMKDTEGELVREGEYVLMPVGVLNEYVKNYFDLDGINLSNIEGMMSDDQRFVKIEAGLLDKVPEFGDESCVLKEINKMPYHQVEVLVDVVDEESGKVEYGFRYIFKLRTEDNDQPLYLIGGEYEVVSNGFVVVTGEYEEVPALDEMKVSSEEELIFIGKSGDGYYFASLNNWFYDEENIIQFYKTNLDFSVGEWIGSVDISAKYGDTYVYGVEFYEEHPVYGGNVFWIRHENGGACYSSDLEFVDDIVYYNYLDEADVSGWVAESDINDAQNMVAFCDENGFNIFNVSSKETINVSQVVNDSKDEMEWTGFGRPRFIAEDRYILVPVFGYEWVDHYELYDVENNELIPFNYSNQRVYNEDVALFNYYSESNHDIRGTLFDFEIGERVLRDIDTDYPDLDFGAGYMEIVGDSLVKRFNEFRDKNYLEIYDLETGEEWLSVGFDEFYMDRLVSSFGSKVLIEVNGAVNGCDYLMVDVGVKE